MCWTLSQLWDIVFGTSCCTHALNSRHSPSSSRSPLAMQIDCIFHFLPLFYLPPLTVRRTLKHTHKASYTAVLVERKFMAHSGVPGVLGPLKYPPPPTVAAHSNQPPPQLQQSGAWETLRSAISFKPHAGRLLAALWFSCACSPSPLRRGVPYKASSEFAHCLNHPALCIIAFLRFLLHPVLFSRLHFQAFDLTLFCVRLWTLGILIPAEENCPFAPLEVLEQLSVMRGILSCSCVNGCC